MAHAKFAPLDNLVVLAEKRVKDAINPRHICDGNISKAALCL